MSRLRELILRARHEWHAPSVVAIAVALLLTGWLSRDPLDLEQAAGKPVDAQITSLSSVGNRYQGRWPGLRVAAATADGAQGVTTALPTDLKGCKVGDRIEAQQSGLKLYLKPRPCE